MPFSYNDLYNIFNDKMVNKYGIDWSEVHEKFLSIGNYYRIRPIGEIIASKMPRIGAS